MSAGPDPASYLSGDAGDVTSRRRRLRRRVAETAWDALDLVSATRRRTDALAERQEPLRVRVLGLYGPGELMAAAVEELGSGDHHVDFALGALGSPDPQLEAHTLATNLAGGKFQNLNRLLELAGDDHDWTLVVDHDVRLPPRFLDRFLALCEHFRLDLAQPAQTQLSHAAWKVTRRQPASLVRETRFVEIGPVTAFGREAIGALTPFPELRFGWGLDLVWAAMAAERGWRLGVVDATPVAHEAAVVASAYGGAEAEEEAARFLAGRRYLPASDAARTIVTHRRLRARA